MGIKDINCKCPKCGESFILGEALEEHAVEAVRAELVALNDGDVEARIEAEKAAALEQGKKIATSETLKQAKLKQKQLDEKEAELNAIKLSQIDKDSELTRLKQQQEATIQLKLAQEKNQWEADKTSSETALRLQIQQLTDDLRKASERATQGSTQAQGEASELAIEETLSRMFPSDDISEIKKGQRGADCLLTVKIALAGQWERYYLRARIQKSFSSDWVPKLKDDAIAVGAEIPVLVTSAWPADNNKIHMRDGAWVCGFHEYTILVRALSSP